MAQNPDHRGSMTFVDFSEEKAGFGFHFGAITAGTIAGFLTQFGAFRTATQAILAGVITADQWVGDATKYANAAPTDPNAQRERVFLVEYEGTTTHTIYTLTMPTADFELTDLFLPGTDEVDLTQTEIAAWITAFEALCKTDAGEAVNVLNITGGGRNR